MRAPVVAFLVLAATYGCSATGSGNRFTEAAASEGAGGGGTGASSGTTGKGSAGTAGTGASGQGGGGLGGGFTVPDAGDPTSGCSAAAELVYVFSTDSDIWSFDPPSKVFTKVATPNCPASSPNSMAIDRNLVAWLNYVGGIYTFDLKTQGPCKDSGISLPAGFEQVGMGFSTDVAGGTTETLYIDGIGGGGLARVDMTTMKVVPIGSFSNDNKLSGQSAELTGTGDARLFGYFTTDPYVRVAEIKKSDSTILSDSVLTGVTPPDDWAFTFWGGDFYLYAASAIGDSAVIQYDPTTKAVNPAYVADVGFQIIGAGVSTCAPTTAPQ